MREAEDDGGDLRAHRHDREQRQHRSEGQDGPEVEEERVGVLGPEVLLEEHLQRVGRDVRTRRRAAGRGARAGRCVARFGPIRSCIIALHLRSASVRNVAMTITKTSIEDQDVADPGPVTRAMPPSTYASRAQAEDGPRMTPNRREDREGFHRQIPRTRGVPNSRYPGGRPSAPVASGLMPRVTFTGGAAPSQSKLASSATRGPQLPEHLAGAGLGPGEAELLGQMHRPRPVRLRVGAGRVGAAEALGDAVEVGERPLVLDVDRRPEAARAPAP